MRRSLPWSLCLLVGALGCGDEQKAPTPTPVTTAGPAGSGAPAQSSQPGADATATPGGAASTAPAAVAEDEAEALPKPRKLRTGERAQIERTFPPTALFDMRQSFQIDLVGQGSCSFVSQTVRAGKPEPVPEPTDAPAPVASASASAAPAASASAEPTDAKPELDPKGPEIAAFAFHLLCRDEGKKDVVQTELPPYPQIKPTWKPDKIVAVSFPDLDDDGKQEIIVVTTYQEGGEGKSIPVVMVYTQKSGKYLLEREWSETATKAGADTVAKVKFALDIEKP